MKSAQQMTLSKARIEKSESKERKEGKERALHAKNEAIQSNYQRLERIPSARPWHPAVSLYICPPSKKARAASKATNRPSSPCRLDPSQGPAARSLSSPSFPASVFCLLMAQSSTFRFVQRSGKQPRLHTPAQRLTGPWTSNVLRERFQHGLVANHGGTNSRRTQGVAVLGVLETQGLGPSKSGASRS